MTISAKQLRSGVQDISELVRYRELLRHLVARDLKVRYRRSILGMVWTMLNPLLMMIVFTIVFSEVFRFATKDFATYFLSAYILWNFFSQTTSHSMLALRNNSSLLKRIYFPRSVFVAATVLSGLVNLVFALIPLLIIFLITGHSLQASLAFLPVPILLTGTFTFGVSLILSAVAIFFEDVIQIYEVLLVIWLYMTPIIYPLEAVPERFHGLIYANPMYYLVEAFRSPIYAAALPDPKVVLIAAGSSLLALVVGWWVFGRSADRFTYYL